jgi:hypothetical protein
VPPVLRQKIDEAVAQASDMPLAGILSSSEELINQELAGTSYLELPEDTPVIRQAYAIFDAIFTS